MTDVDRDLLAQSHRAWVINASYWDEGMGEGNIYFEQLIAPATERLLQLRPNETLLDIACGNGMFARRLAAAGASVVAVDFSAALIERARSRTSSERVDYRVIDATDEGALITLGEGRFDAVVCTMALMDMAAVDPLARAVPRLLRPRGRLVFSVLHPCFNNTSTQKWMEDRYGESGRLERTRGVKVSRYKSGGVFRGEFLAGQPEPHVYFERPLEVLLGSFFDAGLVMDGIEEPAFAPPPPETSGPISWKRTHEIPPILVVRMRPPL